MNFLKQLLFCILVVFNIMNAFSHDICNNFSASAVVNVSVSERTYDITYYEQDSASGQVSSIVYIDFNDCNNDFTPCSSFKSVENNCGIAEINEESLLAGSSVTKVSEKTVVKNNSRKCSALNCSISGVSLHTFPAIIVNGIFNYHNVARCREWIRKCGNELLLDIFTSKLNSKKFLCSSHFETNQYYRSDRKKLLPNAIPSIFKESALSDDVMKRFPVLNEHEQSLYKSVEPDPITTSVVAEVNNDVSFCNSVATVQEVVNNFTAHEGLLQHDNSLAFELSEGDVNEPFTAASSSNNDDMLMNGDEISIESIISSNEAIINSNELVNEPSTSSALRHKKMKIISCCFNGCCNTNENFSIFHFPNVLCVRYGQKRINDSNLRRFMKWIEASGNAQLTLMDPGSVYKKYFVCSSHFEVNCFINSKRLKVNAVPSLNIQCFSSSMIMDDYKRNMNVWKESSGGEIGFCSDSSVALAFDESMKSLHWVTCSNCFERHLTNLKDSPPCQHYSHCWEYTARNNMDPLDVPEELQNLTFIEEQLIARVHPVISVFKLKGLQYGYRGNIISFSQNVNDIATKLPHKVRDLNSVMTVTYKNMAGKCHDFNVRSARVRNALIWLKRNNKFYQDIDISEENLLCLPEDGDVLNEIPTVHINDEQDVNYERNLEEDIADNELENEGHIQTSCVPDVQVPHQDKQIENKIDWPSISTKIDEFNCRGYMVQAFPTLYPYGTADYLDDRVMEVKSCAYFRHLLTYHDRRFVKHQTFRFFAFNSWLRWTGLNDGHMFVRNNEEFRNITVSKLKDMLQENPNLIKKIMFQASNLKGTNAYWHSRAGELKDMVQQLGLPTVFLTLSCADGHWEYLYKILANKDDVSNLTERERRKLLQENPDIVDTFFDMRVQSFIENVLKKKYKVKDFWYRVEYQHRGSPHIHGVFWFEGAPDVRQLRTANEQEIAKVIEYFSELVTAVNPKIDVGEPNTHPCRVSFQNVEDVQEDLAQLLKKVQRHSKCSTEYCIRLNKRTKLKQCRFKFPREMQEKATLEEGENGEIEFKPMRNDPLLNKFNDFIIQLWRANIDIAPVISEKALLAYLTKYISKCEVKSQALHEIVNGIFAVMDEDATAKKFIQRMYMKSCAERDVSAQEVCHIMLGHKLCSAGGRQFVIVNTSDKKWKCVNENDFEDEVQSKGKSFVDKYRERPDRLENISLWNAAMHYNVLKWSSITYGKEHIVRVFPRLSKCDSSERNEAYYRQQVLLHLPWRYEDNIKSYDEEWKDVYDRFNIYEKSKNMYILGNEGDEQDEFELDDDSLSDSEDEEEFMLVSRLAPNNVDVLDIDLGRREVDLDYDWTQSGQNYLQFGSLADFQSFIDKAKQQENSQENNFVLFQGQLSADQQKIMDIINDQISSVLCGQTEVNETLVKRIIIQGKAGTGKSFLIKHITSVLQDKLGPDSYLLAAPTGVSAILINGKTMHSIFKLPRKGSDFTELKGELARDLANKFENVKFLILDEWSMIGCASLFMIDQRCRQATGNYDEDFGGLFVMLLGDGKQLPPINDNSLYSKIQRKDRARRGKALVNNFQKRFLLVTCHRQQGDSNFLKTLDNVGKGDVSLEDYQLLSTRFDHKLSCEERKSFANAIRLFSTKDDVKDFNKNSLAQLKDVHTGAFSPILKISAKHNCAAAKKGSADQAEGLERFLYVAKNCKIMLRNNLWLEKGLVNGAMGTVEDVMYDPLSPDMPAILLCKFENYTGPSLIPNSKVVPIKPILKSWTDSSRQNCTRLQFPVALAYAVSIHKSQGMTLDKAVINIGRNEFAFGLSYVGLSRVRQLKDMIVCPFLYERLKKLRLASSLHERDDFLKLFV